MTSADASDQLLLLLASGRTRDAVELLNAVSMHRYTAMFQFHDGMLGNALLYDRDGGFATPMDPIPIDESYCQFVQSSSQPFVIENASEDVRLLGHPKRMTVRSYVGVPLRTRSGMAFGTICHFDNDPVAIVDGTLDLMELVGGWLSTSHMLDGLLEGFNRRVEALGDVIPIIGDYAADAGDARERFESLARPVREAARVQLPPEGSEAIDRRIDDLRRRSGLDDAAAATG